MNQTGHHFSEYEQQLENIVTAISMEQETLKAMKILQDFVSKHGFSADQMREYAIETLTKFMDDTIDLEHSTESIVDINIAITALKGLIKSPDKLPDLPPSGDLQRKYAELKVKHTAALNILLQVSLCYQGVGDPETTGENISCIIHQVRQILTDSGFDSKLLTE